MIAAMMRFGRFFSVALLFVPLSYVLLFVCIHALDVSGVTANLIVTTVLSPPNFFICRRWVWRVGSGEKMRQQIISFWFSAALSTLITTATIWLAERWFPHSDPAVFVASAGGLVLAGVLRFVFLDRLVFVAEVMTPAVDLLGEEDPKPLGPTALQS